MPELNELDEGTRKFIVQKRCEASFASHTAGGAVAGAAIGSVVPVVGTVIGGVIGGVAGMCKSVNKISELEKATTWKELNKDYISEFISISMLKSIFR